MKKNVLLGTLLIVVFGSMALASCGMFKGATADSVPVEEAAPPAPTDGDGEFTAVDSWTYKSGYSWFTQIPSKDYTIVGIVIVRDSVTPAVALLEAARSLGADEVINIRLDTETTNGKDKVLAASGVAVKYQAAPYSGGAEVGDKIFNSGAVRWSKYSAAPSKDFSVAQIVTVKGSTITTPAADLMEEARKLGAHDIINVRVDTAESSGGGLIKRTAAGTPRKIIGASALAIKYTNNSYTGSESATGGGR